MRLPLFAGLVLAWQCAHAQPTFEKVYFSTTSYKGDLIELGSHNLLTGFAWYPGVSLLDPSGNFIHSKCFYGDSVLTMASVRKLSENKFFFVALYQKDSCDAAGTFTVPYTHPAIGIMDTLGTIQNFHHYPLNADACGNIPGGLSVTNDSGAITWGSRSWFFALRIDSTMSPVWGRRYSRHGGFQFIKELPSGDLLAGINMDTAGAVIARMDANGNFLWCKSYIRPRGMVHDAVIESDSSFIITGYTDSTTAIAFIPLPNDYHPKLFMMKLDGGGGVQWCKGYDSAPNLWYSYAGSRIQPTLDGHHVIVATLGVPGYNLFHRPYLMKTDLNGDTLWTRSVGVNGYEYTAADLLVCSDGGIMFSGGILGNLPENQTGMPYIFKTDSLGHFSCADSSYPVVVSDLFPVDSSFTLVSVDGAAMLPAFANDTVFDPIAVYDACLITTIVPSVRAHPPKLSVRPNPTTGFVTMTFADPLAVESYYSVYDAMGRLLYQRPLPTGATAEEIDLSRFGKGTYVIKLTDPDGVCHERVVLE